MFGISSEQSKIAPEKFSRRAESRSKLHIKYDQPYMVGSCKKATEYPAWKLSVTVECNLWIERKSAGRSAIYFNPSIYQRDRRVAGADINKKYLLKDKINCLSYLPTQYQVMSICYCF